MAVHDLTPPSTTHLNLERAANLPEKLVDAMAKLEAAHMRGRYARNGRPFVEIVRFPGMLTAWKTSQDGTLAGFIMVSKLHANTLVIWELHVAKPWRRQGLGTALINAAAQDFGSGLQLELNVHLKNTGARKFYVMNGFEQEKAGEGDTVLTLFRNPSS